jgi:hypothetical protein
VISAREIRSILVAVDWIEVFITYSSDGPMTEVLVRYTEPIVGDDGVSHLAEVCGRRTGDGLWEGWIEFLSDSGRATRTSRESHQPSRDMLIYWAAGLTYTYLQGALIRAVTPRFIVPPKVENRAPSMFDGPATGRPHVEGLVGRPVLDPFSTIEQGEGILRRQLGALSRDHIITIVNAYRLDVPPAVRTQSNAALIDAIVAAVKGQPAVPVRLVGDIEHRV